VDRAEVDGSVPEAFIDLVDEGLSMPFWHAPAPQVLQETIDRLTAVFTQHPPLPTQPVPELPAPGLPAHALPQPCPATELEQDPMLLLPASLI
jgi:hypothetical protein